MYIRPLGKAETRAIQTHQEMRDLLDQAVEQEIGRLRELGLVAPGGTARAEVPMPFQGFDEEIEDLR